MVPTTCLSKKFKPSLGLDLIDSQSSLIFFLQNGQIMYFGVNIRDFQGFFALVWFGVGQVQKTEFSHI